MYDWFECKVRYEKELGEGKVKKVIEPYLVDAMSFTEAERRIIAEMKPFMSGEFQVSDIKRAKFAELFETDQESADKWYQCKLAFITLDEKSGTEKRTSQTVLVQAAELREAVKRLDEGMKSSLIDYSITNVSETKLMGVYHYQEQIPEGYTKVNEDNVKNN